MKYSILFLLLTFAIAQMASAQTTVSGTIKDEKGSPLHFVFIEDAGYKLATFSDSLGNFSIPVYPDSKLSFELTGYESASIANANNANWQVVLKSASSASNGGEAQGSLEAKGMTLQRPDNIDLNMLPGHQKGNVHGNRYLFDNFVHGFFINSSGDLAHAKDYTFDYDKIGGGLMLTKDNVNVMQLSWDQIKSFTLFSNKDETYTFDKVPAIDPSHYSQVIASGKKYKIYKLIKTKFTRADYVNTGVTQHGNDYDEYVDDADYYVMDTQTNQIKKFTLRKKSIKEAFFQDADKVNKFMSANSGDIDDAYLNKLGDALNQ
ncbi:MAG: carboxypeptidase regulatory-like domain-containing protein [Bacteroidetes bacterium]|jgi:hypothetical protein|nr:carboxypeptidase regulatory-like domain-containing protein [Bacteroidota bacterium]